VQDLALRQRIFYNEWERYKKLYTHIDLNWYKKALDSFCRLLGNACQILDVGCGIGITTDFLRRRYRNTIGIDYSLEFCKMAREKNERGSLVINADAAALPIRDRSIDGIFSFGAIEHMHDVRASLGEMDRVLKRDGVILIHMPDLLTPLRPLKAILSREELKYPKPESGNNCVHSFYLILRDVFFLLRKWGSRDASFLSREPNFEIVEGDYDAVYLSSPLDIKKYFRKRNYRVEDLTFPYRPYVGRGWVKKALKWLLFKTKILRMIRMSSGTYSTLVLRKS
jgi:ubiquinone/menaquinone biosynthesis C-methylase UbiE